MKYGRDRWMETDFTLPNGFFELLPLRAGLIVCSFASAPSELANTCRAVRTYRGPIRMPVALDLNRKRGCPGVPHFGFSLATSIAQIQRFGTFKVSVTSTRSSVA